MLPMHTKKGIDLYVDKGYPVGDFLYAVLTNDLMDAAGRADDINRYALYDICIYIYNYIPRICWGSAKAVSNWLKTHRENSESIKLAIECDASRRANYYQIQEHQARLDLARSDELNHYSSVADDLARQTKQELQNG